jgi:hypothetical protein
MREASFGLALLLVACGGIAVIDPGSGGSGGEGGSSSTEGGSPLCSTPPPVGTPVFCGGSAVGGGGTLCTTSVCDEAGNTWTSDCSATACVCSFNFATECTCALTSPGQFCDGVTPTCCPAPFQ